MTMPGPPENNTAPAGGSGSAKPPAVGATLPPAHGTGNQPTANSGFNQLRNEFLTAARRVSIIKKQTIGEVVEWASRGAFKHGDIGCVTEADTTKLRAAAELMASALAGPPR